MLLNIGFEMQLICTISFISLLCLILPLLLVSDSESIIVVINLLQKQTKFVIVHNGQIPAAIFIPLQMIFLGLCIGSSEISITCAVWLNVSNYDFKQPRGPY